MATQRIFYNEVNIWPKLQEAKIKAPSHFSQKKLHFRKDRQQDSQKVIYPEGHTARQPESQTPRQPDRYTATEPDRAKVTQPDTLTSR